MYLAKFFVPGVNWFPGVQTVASPVAEPSADNALLSGYPLPNRTDIVVNYGWQPAPAQDRLVFNTGIALAAREATPVLAVGPGTVAFAGNDQVYGNLVVVNHEQGLQTRYANLGTVEVEVGQSIQRGTPLGQVGPADGEESFFIFLRCVSILSGVGLLKILRIMFHLWLSGEAAASRSRRLLGSLFMNARFMNAH